MEKSLIRTEHASYSYSAHKGFERDLAVNDLNIEIKRGEFVAVLGRNGSGKSTLAKLLNALFIPDEGIVYVDGISTVDETQVWEIRRKIGMVFQNPDNQIVGTSVEEDVAFGPENLGVPPLEIRKRVDEALSMVGISDYAKHAPHLLSGGQKQRVAIAGILAMKPDCIVLDEATSMLDPIGRKEVMAVLKKLNTREGITIIHITHHMDEASLADRVLVMDHGKIVLSGTPKYVFSNVEVIKNLGLEVPQVTELFYVLRKEGIELPNGVLDVDEAVNLVKDYLEKST